MVRHSRVWASPHFSDGTFRPRNLHRKLKGKPKTNGTKIRNRCCSCYWQFCSRGSFHIFPHLSTVNFEVHHQSSHIPQRVLRRSWQLLPGAECSFGVVYSMWGKILEASFCPSQCTITMHTMHTMHNHIISQTVTNVTNSIFQVFGILVQVVKPHNAWCTFITWVPPASGSDDDGFSYEMNVRTGFKLSERVQLLKLCPHILSTGTSLCCIYVHSCT